MQALPAASVTHAGHSLSIPSPAHAYWHSTAQIPDWHTQSSNASTAAVGGRSQPPPQISGLTHSQQVPSEKQHPAPVCGRQLALAPVPVLLVTPAPPPPVGLPPAPPAPPVATVLVVAETSPPVPELDDALELVPSPMVDTLSAHARSVGIGLAFLQAHDDLDLPFLLGVAAVSLVVGAIFAFGKR
jgi:hypothetical protein